MNLPPSRFGLLLKMRRPAVSKIDPRLLIWARASTLPRYNSESAHPNHLKRPLIALLPARANGEAGPHEYKAVERRSQFPSFGKRSNRKSRWFFLQADPPSFPVVR